MEMLSIEVMKMQKQNNLLSQKLKDRAFYVALGLGLIAILAVVVVYTMGQNGGDLAQQKEDFEAASEFAQEEETIELEPNVENKNWTSEKYAMDEKNVSTDHYGAVDLEDEGVNTDLAVVEQETTEASKIEAVDETAKNEQKEEENLTTTDSIPVVADAGQLDFTSESTIGWPVSGSVILPYSMETTVYFKTLDQYRCNPGMLISAGNGTTVKNAYLGQVTKVTSDNTYGNMVTVYLGNDYSVVYGQLDTIYVKEGDFVKAGESIGTVGNPTESFQDEGSHLFFQMYEKDEPVDPVLYME